MGNIIDPVCSQPPFVLPDAFTASRCTSYTMLLVAVVVTIIVTIILMMRLRLVSIDPSTQKEVKYTNWSILIKCLVILVIVWALIPALSWFTGRSWTAEQKGIDELVKASGGKLTRGDVIKQMTDTYYIHKQARAYASGFRGGPTIRLGFT
jgi:hypothetical protein